MQRMVLLYHSYAQHEYGTWSSERHRQQIMHSGNAHNAQWFAFLGRTKTDICDLSHTQVAWKD